MYCAHNDGKEAYSQIEGTLYCKDHIQEITEANQSLESLETVEPTSAGDKLTSGFF